MNITFLAGKSRRLYKTLICGVFLIPSRIKSGTGLLRPLGQLRASSDECHGELVEPSKALHLNVFEQPGKNFFPNPSKLTSISKS
jgi:hypothetical protein